MTHPGRELMRPGIRGEVANLRWIEHDDIGISAGA
jgi:hypothetical protein